jgi:NAD(P)-dependent dehydrogenase (short-subunit alcohol dehydrogenase family)
MNRYLLLAAAGVGGYLIYQALRPRYDFTGKHALITGGSRGLGLVMARQLAEKGARLTLCSRDGKELLRAQDDLAARGFRKVLVVECDVTDEARVREMVAVARERNGPVDVLVNNAGIIQVGPMEEMRAGDFEQSLDTHFWAALHTTLAVLPDMKARGSGRIVNVSSIGGKIAVPHLLPYSVGKFALVGLSDGLRAEVARYGVTVTTACPGLMRTGSHLNAEFKGRHADEYAWFALLNGLPGVSTSAESASRQILSACAVGDAEVVVGLPAKLAVLGRAMFPNLSANLMALTNRYLLPDPGGIGAATLRGRESRGKLPAFVTKLIDKAAVRNNELHATVPATGG